MVDKINVDSVQNLVNYILMNSLIHLCERGNLHDCIYVDALDVGAASVVEEPMALYLAYYDWSSSQQLYLMDLWIVHLSV
jgi:hypothetical protein